MQTWTFCQRHFATLRLELKEQDFFTCCQSIWNQAVSNVETDESKLVDPFPDAKVFVDVSAVWIWLRLNAVTHHEGCKSSGTAYNQATCLVHVNINLIMRRAMGTFFFAQSDVTQQQSNGRHGGLASQQARTRPADFPRSAIANARATALASSCRKG